MADDRLASPREASTIAASPLSDSPRFAAIRRRRRQKASSSEIAGAMTGDDQRAFDDARARSVSRHQGARAGGRRGSPRQARARFRRDASRPSTGRRRRGSRPRPLPSRARAFCFRAWRRLTISLTLASVTSCGRRRSTRLWLRRRGRRASPPAGWTSPPRARTAALPARSLPAPARRRRFLHSDDRRRAARRRLRHARLELEAERHRRIGEAGDRIERHDQSFGLAGEVEVHFERVLGDHQVPELMLQDDRHLVGKAALDRGRNDDPRRVGLERDVEVMVADEAGARSVGEHLAHHGAQRVLHQEVVANEVGRHEE